MRLFIPLLLLLSSPVLDSSVASNGGNPASISSKQAALLAQWYGELGEPRSDEAFGDFLVRAALLKLGSPYRTVTETNRPERLQVDLTHFDCVSVIDTSLALARCAWLGDPSGSCFVRELVGNRYRNGIINDFPSRLHYFEDWLDYNLAQHRLDDRMHHLGGLLLRRRFFYMSEHQHLFPPMADPGVRGAIARTEARLSKRTYAVILGSSIREKDALLQNGDLLGVVTREPGRLISHTGLVVRDGKGPPRLLHASSYRHRVVLTATSIANYILRRRERWGIIVARPNPPAPNRQLLLAGSQTP
jgi:hypothetical protein